MYKLLDELLPPSAASDISFQPYKYRVRAGYRDMAHVCSSVLQRMNKSSEV
jgi:hypothetical protein